MAKWSEEPDDDENDEDDREAPDAHDLAAGGDDEDFGDDATVPCPNCGRQVYDDVDYCPHCGDAITPMGGGIPTWAWVTGIVLLLSFVATALLAWR
ncbi:MAG TPA: zinc ribbon domain-containing protein [Tepidisphaeraceae bacterium]|nr:zinc ribbon domain-containing protein [Tepidisphaeraceae bacterium]